MEKTIELKTPITALGATYTKVIKTAYEHAGGPTALVLKTNDNDPEYDIIITVNIPPLTNQTVIAINVNSSTVDEILPQLIENKLIGEQIGSIPSGWVLFPIFKIGEAVK